jgi:hypothetical protein
MNCLFRRKDRYCCIVEITPDLAEQWITERNSHNRKLVEAHAERLAGEMKANRWRLTHQGIAFNTNGVLTDGQHRLWAIVLSGVTVRTWVFFNEPVESLGAVDVIRGRTNDEVITLAGGMGEVNKRDLATLRAMINGLGSYDRLMPGEEGEIWRVHAKAVAFAQEILPAARFRGVANAVTRGVLARAFYSVDHAKLRHFADVLQSALPSGEKDEPIMLLVKFLIEASHGLRGRPESRERYAKTERALWAYLTGERLSRLYAATNELFPLPGELEAVPAA